MSEIPIILPNDYEGKITATLISAPSTTHTTRAVLYIHGYIDYFFQQHMAEHFNNAKFNFYAIDLRKYGRSLIEGQHPNYCRAMSEYFPEIDAAIRHICNDGNQDITLLGHSTGGLIAAVYCAQGAQRALINRLLLNSPFLEFNTTWFKRRVAIPLAALFSRVFVYAHKTNELSEHYFSSVHCSERGEWEFDTHLKPKHGIPLYFAWLGAVRAAQRMVRHGLGLQIPVLVMHSAHSWKGRKWSEQATVADAVLNVDHIARYAPMLGSQVKVMSVKDGLHDLILSKKEVRDMVFERMIDWIEHP